MINSQLIFHTRRFIHTRRVLFFFKQRRQRRSNDLPLFGEVNMSTPAILYEVLPPPAQAQAGHGARRIGTDPYRNRRRAIPVYIPYEFLLANKLIKIIPTRKLIFKIFVKNIKSK